jgi:hypothetical protein
MFNMNVTDCNNINILCDRGCIYIHTISTRNWQNLIEITFDIIQYSINQHTVSCKMYKY